MTLAVEAPGRGRRGRRAGRLGRDQRRLPDRGRASTRAPCASTSCPRPCSAPASTRCAPATRLNLELSLRLGDRLGGHLVYGHVDDNAAILAKEPEGQGFRLHVALPPALAPFIVEKGYVAVDGVSLTVASARPDRFTIALIPETARRTTLGTKRAGDRVNLEIDPVARYAQARDGRLRAAAARPARPPTRSRGRSRSRARPHPRADASVPPCASACAGATST